MRQQIPPMPMESGGSPLRTWICLVSKSCDTYSFTICSTILRRSSQMPCASMVHDFRIPDRPHAERLHSTRFATTRAAGACLVRIRARTRIDRRPQRFSRPIVSGNDGRQSFQWYGIRGGSLQSHRQSGGPSLANRFVAFCRSRPRVALRMAICERTRKSSVAPSVVP